MKFFKNLVYCFFIIIFLSFFNSCDKEPKIIYQTVIETDTLIITEYDTITINTTDTVNITEYIHDSATTFILIKHAEKMTNGTDPELTEEGMERANSLIKILENTDLAAVYSTDYKRTTHTVEPVAASQSLTIETYNGFNLNPVIYSVLDDHFEKTVLVVGHSNTTPDLLNKLIGEDQFPVIPEDEYDNLYIVTVIEKGNAKVLHLKYGQ